MMRNSKIFLLCIGLMMMLMLASCGKKSEETMQVEKNDVEEAVVEQEPADQNPSDGADNKEESSKGNINEENNIQVESIHILTGTCQEYDWSETYNQLMVKAVYPVVELDACCTEKYSELAQTLNNLNEAESSIVLSNYEDLRGLAATDILERPEYFGGYVIEEDVAVRRADTKVLSLLFNGYTYSGGAHGSTYYRGENIDVTTGKKLKLSDVITDVTGLSELIKVQFDKYGYSEGLYPDLDLNEYISSNIDNIVWILDCNGITFVFNAYDIGPYAAGMQMATLSFAEYPDLVKEEYQVVMESYGIEVSENSPFYYDLNGDGALDKMTVDPGISEFDHIEKHIITVNDSCYESSAYAYSIDPVFIHTSDGKNYLYIQDTMDNDYRIIHVYDLGNGVAQKTGSIDAGWYTLLFEDRDYWGLKQVITDPQQFKLEVRTDILSTVSGYLDYKVGTNGVPESDGQWFLLGNDRYLTLRQALDVDVIIEETGEKIGETTLAAGTEVLYYRTDNESIADLKLEDGTVVRVYVDNKAWPRYVGDIEIEDLFDGMVFAG